MYQPHVFREERLQTLHSLIRARPLATLITAGPGGLLANLVPFTLVDGGEKGILRAHIAKANDQVDALRSGAETLMVFQGPEVVVRIEARTRLRGLRQEGISEEMAKLVAQGGEDAL